MRILRRDKACVALPYFYDLSDLGAHGDESTDPEEWLLAIQKWRREVIKKEQRRQKAWKKRKRKREAQDEALADVLWRLEQLANFVPSGKP